MKKWVSVLLTVVMVFSLTSCGDSGDESDLKEPEEVSTSLAETSSSSASEESSAADGESEPASDSEDSAVSSTTDGESEPALDSEDSAVSSTTDGESESASDSEDSETFSGVDSGAADASDNQDASISETVLIDSDNIKITAKSIDYDGTLGPELKLEIENNSDQNLTFQCRNVSVNQYMVDVVMSADVAAGKKANDGLTFQKSSLEDAGIDAIADMEFSFHIFTTEDWDTYLDSDMIQLKTSIADTYEYIFDDSGELAYEGNGIKITVRGLSEDSSILGPQLMLYIENLSEQDITVQIRDSSINGYMVDGIFSSDVNIGKHCVDGITFGSSNLEENGIDEIQDIELSFHIFNTESWDTIVDTPPVTITF